MIKRKTDWFLILAVLMMIGLFYSSTMTYHQQTSVPLLERLLQHEPLKQWLSQFTLHYAGSEQSV